MVKCTFFEVRTDFLNNYYFKLLLLQRVTSLPEILLVEREEQKIVKNKFIKFNDNYFKTRNNGPMRKGVGCLQIVRQYNQNHANKKSKLSH
jgi:hypothetical protein